MAAARADDSTWTALQSQTAQTPALNRAGVGRQTGRRDFIAELMKNAAVQDWAAALKMLMMAICNLVICDRAEKYSPTTR